MLSLVPLDNQPLKQLPFMESTPPSVWPFSILMISCCCIFSRCKPTTHTQYLLFLHTCMTFYCIIGYLLHHIHVKYMEDWSSCLCIRNKESKSMQFFFFFTIFYFYLKLELKWWETVWICFFLFDAQQSENVFLGFTFVPQKVLF